LSINPTSTSSMIFTSEQLLIYLLYNNN